MFWIVSAIRLRVGWSALQIDVDHRAKQISESVAMLRRWFAAVGGSLFAVIPAQATTPIFVAAATNEASTTLRAPGEAAGAALIQCVAHTMGLGTISSASADRLAENGLRYSDSPPQYLAGAAETPYGKGSFVNAPSTEGQIWAIGYDGPGTACIVFALGTSVDPIEARVRSLFSVPHAWRPESAARAEEGERKLQYGWDVAQPKRHLTALISIRDWSNQPAKGMVMITVSQTFKK